MCKLKLLDAISILIANSLIFDCLISQKRHLAYIHVKYASLSNKALHTSARTSYILQHVESMQC